MATVLTTLQHQNSGSLTIKFQMLFRMAYNLKVFRLKEHMFRTAVFRTELGRLFRKSFNRHMLFLRWSHHPRNFDVDHNLVGRNELSVLQMKTGLLLRSYQINKKQAVQFFLLEVVFFKNPFTVKWLVSDLKYFFPMFNVYSEFWYAICH